MDDGRVEFDESVRVRSPSAELFAVLADVQKWAVYPGAPVRSMEKSPAGPTTVGTRWREVVRLGPGLSMTMWSEVTDVVPDRLLALRFWGGSMEGTITYTFTPSDGDTVLRQQETMRATGWLRPLDKAVGSMLRVRLSRRLHDIRDLLEHRRSA